MKLPVSWLRELVTVEASAEEIAARLTARGFYVEGVESHGHPVPGVVVARVLEVAKHPNADKLSLCRVDGGAGELRVVCGAPNVRAGMIVPLATVGAKLPGGLVIKRSRIRGEESQGMLCSARELELSADADGILDLERFLAGRALTVGRPLDELLPPPDAVLEVEIPFNRPDGLGIVGLAREVKAAFGAAWTPRARAILGAAPGAALAPGARGAFDLALEDPEGCPVYAAQVVEGVTIAPSPAWLVRRLETMGQRALNNVVDVTNLVLLELGQPVHAFDLAKLAGPAIRVRRARAGEKLVTLDGRERELDPEVLVIADAAGATALAGVMGGAASEVTEATTALLLECAWFEPRRVRRGSRRLALTTEASKRFERGVDPRVGAVAVARFLALLAEVSPGCRPGALTVADHRAGSARTMSLRPSRWRRILGVEVPVDEAARHLEALEFGVTRGDPALEVTIPSWRVDMTCEDDLVEEIGRSHGYDRIPEAPLETHGVHATRGAAERVRARARRAMIARGLTEAWTTTLVSEREALAAAALLGQAPESLVRLANPMSRESEVLRPSPVPGLLRACAHNLRQGVAAVRLFEIGAGFAGRGDGALPVETPMAAAIVTGPRYAHAHDAAQAMVDWDEARGLWEAWLAEMGVDATEWRSYSGAGWKPGASAEVARGASRIAWAGSLAQAWLREWGVEVPATQPVHLFVAVLGDAIPESSAPSRVGVPGRFPPARRDVAYFVPEHVTHDELVGALRGAGGEWLQSIELFDVYAGPGTPAGMKSLAFALQFQHPERTLEEAEVAGVQDRMTAAVAKGCGGRLRER